MLRAQKKWAVPLVPPVVHTFSLVQCDAGEVPSIMSGRNVL
jgi:hypothetical protein